MNNLVFLIVAIILGVALSLQPPINAAMSRSLGSPFLAATISIAISLIVVSLLWLTTSKGESSLVQIKSLPLWFLVGGVVGAMFVAGAIVVAPVLGIALFFVCVVAGQLIGSTLIDQFGAFGLSAKPVSLVKLAGLVLVLFGAFLVQISD